MIRELIPNFNIDSRQLIASKIIIMFSFGATGFFSIYNFIDGANILFYIDFSIFLMLLLFYFILIKKNIDLLAKISFFLMMTGLVMIVHQDGGRNNVYLWTFVGLFYMLLVFGPKKGLIYSGGFFLIIFYLMYTFIGESITEQGYVRFIVISITLITISFAYEHAINVTLAKLNVVQKELEKMAKIDSLTTLFNRRYFDEIFPNKIKIAKRNRRFLIFAMADIDSFKKHNDTYGHQAGDEVLKSISRCFLDSMQRPDDYVFRLGGEEFGLLFQADDKNEGLKVVEKIRQNIEDLKIAHIENSVSLYVTVSIGLHVIKPQDKHDYDEIYKIADDALYEAKQKGKNRVEVL